MLGPCFAEAPFNYAWKGTAMFNNGHWLKSAIESTCRHQVTSVPTWEFYRLPPGRWDEVLATRDVVVFSDVELKNFQLIRENLPAVARRSTGESSCRPMTTGHFFRRHATSCP